MNRFILNIGLARDGAATLDFLTVANRTAVALRGFGKAFEAAEHVSTTERTAVLVFDCPKQDLSAEQATQYLMAFTGAIHSLAEEFGQDCIAVYVPARRKGRLIGPRAAAWGEFNPSYFLLANGSDAYSDACDDAEIAAWNNGTPAPSIPASSEV